MTENLPILAQPRLPYHPAVEKRFGIDKASWKALVEAVFPNAKTTESVILALSYCHARRMDPFKRCVHIVPIWDSQKGKHVETIWPGIGELRTTAFRTGMYAGRDSTDFGPDVTSEFEFKPERGNARIIKVTHPEWASVRVYRMVGGNRVAFDGPRVYWRETYSTIGKSDAPNSMWEKRPRGQLDKCAEAAALRAAFPEETGDMMTDDEVGVVHRPNGIINGEATKSSAAGLRNLIEQSDTGETPADDATPDPSPEQDHEPTPEAAPDAVDFAEVEFADVDQLILAVADHKGVPEDVAEQQCRTASVATLKKPLAQATLEELVTLWGVVTK